MLSANSTRDINQAARSAAKYLKELGYELPHAKAMDLVARLLGKPHHMAAQAALSAPGLSEPVSMGTYADLQRALSMLTPQQLQMSITVTEGCDGNGNAEFFPAFEFMCAGDDALLAASDGVLEAEQPVLLFNGPFDDDETYDGTDDESGRSPVPFAILDGVCRILANKDVDKALWTEGISDAAYASLAEAAPYLSDDILQELNTDVLNQAVDNHRSESTEGLPPFLARYISERRERDIPRKVRPLKAFCVSLYREHEDEGGRELVEETCVVCETAQQAREFIHEKFWHPQYDSAGYRATYETYSGQKFAEDSLATEAVAEWLVETVTEPNYEKPPLVDRVWDVLVNAGAPAAEGDDRFEQDKVVDALRAASKSFKNASALLQGLYSALPADSWLYVMNNAHLEELDDEVRFAG